jgi:hypothetical protein
VTGAGWMRWNTGAADDALVCAGHSVRNLWRAREFAKRNPCSIAFGTPRFPRARPWESDGLLVWRKMRRIDGLIEALARQAKGCERLMTVPGIGPIISSATVAASQGDAR